MSTTTTSAGESAEIRFGVQGMTCASCVGRVERVLAKQPGVAAATVNLATETAAVRLDPATADVPALLAAVADYGYAPRLAQVELAVRQMTCASCVGRVERALGKLPGVLEARVNLATERAWVQYLPQVVSSARIAAAIGEAGYPAADLSEQPPDTEAAARAAELARLRRDMLIAAAFALPLVGVAMGPMLFAPLAAWMAGLLPAGGWEWVELALATPVLVAGRRFFKGGWAELRHRAPGMNTLVMLGSSAAYLYSLVVVLAPGIFPAGTAHLYFEASAVIVTLILVGKWLEARAKGRTSEAIRKLMRLQARTARVMRDGVATEVPIEAVVPGDLIVTRPGERLPVDGEVVEGSTYVDESMITGEPVPAAKGPGDEVTGGTVNETGAFTFRATRVGADTVLARIIAMVEEAQATKPAIQALADRIAAVFVPIVIALAALTFVAWLSFGPAPALSFAVVAAVSVLVIACPCAMGLATPTAIVVGTGRAAEMGTLFRRGTALETLARVERVVLDKTGTLTKGRPELTEIERVGEKERVGGLDEAALLRLVAAAEDQSEHPVARAIVQAARDRALTWGPATAVEAVPGFGLQATAEGRRVQIGAARYMDRLGIEHGALADRAAALADRGRTPLYVAVDGVLEALLAVADPLKAGSPKAVAALRELGLQVAMLTGDNQRTAQAVARQAGIDSVLAEVLPDRKAAEIKRLQGEGHAVVFVGDGINDAPALAQADVGVAIGTGTDIAIEAGDVILMSGDLRGIVNAIALARRTLRTIQLNFFWAYAYNVVLIPVAAGALYPFLGRLLDPMLAAGAMSLSSLFVISNSLRLRRFTPPLPAEPGPVLG